MPSKPRLACPVCRRVGCQDPEHRERWRRQRQARPYNNAERMRRAEAVKAWREAHGDWCPVCERMTSDLTADHIIPFAVSGSEESELRVICRHCNSRRGEKL
jgi:5-methylcytosine-specific restriction endonuclease McrA